jgi:hypothetical protein
MPVLRSQDRQIAVGDYYVNRRTGVLVEIVEIDLSGNCRVLDAAAPLDADLQPLTASQIASCLWQHVEPGGHDAEHAIAA